MSTPTNSWR